MWNATAWVSHAEENHHPDIELEGYNKVTMRYSTHSVGGLEREGFFVCAGKVDALGGEDRREHAHRGPLPRKAWRTECPRKWLDWRGAGG